MAEAGEDEKQHLALSPCGSRSVDWERAARDLQWRKDVTPRCGWWRAAPLGRSVACRVLQTTWFVGDPETWRSQTHRGAHCTCPDCTWVRSLQVKAWRGAAIQTGEALHAPIRAKSRRSLGGGSGLPEHLPTCAVGLRGKQAFASSTRQYSVLHAWQVEQTATHGAEQHFRLARDV